MQIKVKFSAATEDSTENLHMLQCHIDNLMARATDAAVLLYTISDTCTSFQSSGQIQREIAIKLKTVVDALTSLARSLNIAPRRSLLSPEDVKLLAESIENCTPVLNNVSEVARQLDGYLGSNTL